MFTAVLTLAFAAGLPCVAQTPQTAPAPAAARPDAEPNVKRTVT